MLPFLALLSLIGCTESKTRHYYREIDDKNYSCTCTKKEESEMECEKGAPVNAGDDYSFYCDYEESFECQCKEAIKVQAQDYQCHGRMCM